MDGAASPLTRRNLLFGVAGVAVCAAIALPRLRPEAARGTRGLLAGNPLTRRLLSLADAGQAEWATQVGSVLSADGGYRLRLEGVRPLPSGGPRPAGLGRERAFLAVFEVLDGMTMPGDLIYTARHGDYGALPLFLSAAGSPSRMLAVFN